MLPCFRWTESGLFATLNWGNALFREDNAVAYVKDVGAGELLSLFAIDVGDEAH